MDCILICYIYNFVNATTTIIAFLQTLTNAKAPDKGLKQGCPLSPLLYSLFTNDLARFLSAGCGAMTAVEHTKVSKL